MNDKGLLLVISGFSGTGKGTVIKGLLDRYQDEYSLSVSATTRSPRNGEENGREYFFKSHEEFEAMIKAQELVEYACYVDNYYGTPKAYIEDCMDKGKNVILEIEIQGALNVKRLYPEAVLIFLFPPDIRELERRLKERGTEDDAVIAARLERATQEIESAYDYDYIIVNETVDQCIEDIRAITFAQRHKADRQSDFIKNLQKDMNGTLS